MAIARIKPLIVITGPTASGKTSLAIRIAKQYRGEIICADSRTIYKGMDIGTAKPALEERQGVAHWGLDLVEPGESFSAAQFKSYAVDVIADIRARNKVPIMVGGTGLYIDAVVYDYQFGQVADTSRRTALMNCSLEELYSYCIKNNIELPENALNKRYVVRAIEQKGMSVKGRETPIDHSIVVGIITDRQTLRARIVERAEQIFAHGVVEEANILGKKYGWDCEAMTGNIYPLAQQLLEGALTLSEAKQKFITSDWRLAKRQLTWLRRNPFLLWLTTNDAEHYLAQKLASHDNS